MKLLAFLLMVLVTGGCASVLLGASGDPAGRPIGQDPRNIAQISADDRLSTTVRSKLALDADLSHAGLRVATRNGVVTLRGIVASFAQRDRAVSITADINGVLRVDNQIGVNSN